MHPGCISVANAKGGVGKTSIVANLAGIAALGGARTLAIDLDPQGNLGADLGYNHDGRTDDGAALAAAIEGGGLPEPIRDVRTNLDVIAGGEQLQSIAGLPDAEARLVEVVRSVAAGYSFVVIDCPPGGGALVDAALLSSRWLLVPVKADHGSLDGLQMMANRFGRIRLRNPYLELLGVTLFDIGSTSTSILRSVVATLDADLNGIAPVLQPPIRRSERSAYDMRRLGLLAHEYQESAGTSDGTTLADRFDAAAEGRRLKASSAAPALAEDYLRVTTQVLQKIASGFDSDRATPVTAEAI